MTDFIRGRELIMRVTEIDSERASLVDEGELVRCRDCRHSDETPEGGMPVCDKLHRRVPSDGYCHLGERSEAR